MGRPTHVGAVDINYAKAKREILDQAIHACARHLPTSREGAPKHWEAYAAAWGLREAIVNECLATLRRLSEEVAPK